MYSYFYKKKQKLKLKELIFFYRPGAKIVICTNSKLVEAVSKLVVFGLDRYVDVADVYSSHKVGKSSLYDRIKRKYGEKNSYVVVGTVDSKEHAQQVRYLKNFLNLGFRLVLMACFS